LNSSEKNRVIEKMTVLKRTRVSQRGQEGAKILVAQPDGKRLRKAELSGPIAGSSIRSSVPHSRQAEIITI